MVCCMTDAGCLLPSGERNRFEREGAKIRQLQKRKRGGRMLYNIYRFDTLYFLFAENAFFRPDGQEDRKF